MHEKNDREATSKIFMSIRVLVGNKFTDTKRKKSNLSFDILFIFSFFSRRSSHDFGLDQDRKKRRWENDKAQSKTLFSTLTFIFLCRICDVIFSVYFPRRSRLVPLYHDETLDAVVVMCYQRTWVHWNFINWILEAIRENSNDFFFVSLFCSKQSVETNRQN